MSESISWGEYLTKGVPPFKRVLIGGNWKCNGTVKQAKDILKILNESGNWPIEAEVVIAVPSIHLSMVKSIARKDINVCSQDVAYNEKVGAYTGEVTATLLTDIGVKWAIIGHSERRVGFGGPGESSAQVAIKTKNALTAGMSVILCTGEMLADRESGKTMDVCIEQLSACTAILKPEDWKRIVIAYEPVWAIGTGKVATPAQAEETHMSIRKWMEKNVSSQVATDIRIVYGGSVKGSNCTELIKCPNIDGFLIGGASLLPEFVDCIKCASEK